jgi:hypothetical protein
VEVAETLGRALGRPVRAESESIDAWGAGAGVPRMGDYQREALIKMLRYYDRHGLVGNPTVLRHVLGRPPTTLDEFAARSAASR